MSDWDKALVCAVRCNLNNWLEMNPFLATSKCSSFEAIDCGSMEAKQSKFSCFGHQLL